MPELRPDFPHCERRNISDLEMQIAVDGDDERFDVCEQQEIEGQSTSTSEMAEQQQEPSAVTNKKKKKVRKRELECRAMRA